VAIYEQALAEIRAGHKHTATVQDDSRIEFRGKATSLSAAASLILQEFGYSSLAYQGTVYWLYDGDTLDDRRRAREEAAAGIDVDD